MKGITLNRLRHPSNLNNSYFLKVYESLKKGGTLSESENVYLLRIAIIFLCSDDRHIQKMGYSIVLSYSNLYDDYEPLYDVAMNHNYMPVSSSIKRYDEKHELSFSEMFSEAYQENFRVEKSGEVQYRSLGQLKLTEFAKLNDNFVLVAPTSYGKSEMLREKLKSHKHEKVCVIVPTKALLTQTRSLIANDPALQDIKIITHPDMYRGDDQFIAIMTQERLLRLLTKHVDLSLDRVLVDEAHNILEKDQRQKLLAQVLLICKKRNGNLSMGFFTPFLMNPENLRIVNLAGIPGLRTNEHMKIEKIHLVSPEEGTLEIYDQFLDKFFIADEPVNSEIEFIIKHSAEKNIIYINKPRHAHEVAEKLLSVTQPDYDAFAKETAALSKFIHPDYDLIKYLKHGIGYHHGRLPDVVRLYVEDLFANNPKLRFLIANSTLLEGVNTPAQKMFILCPKKGPSLLKAAQFRNLVGRVNRFNEVFNPAKGSLKMLEPEIYLIDGTYCDRIFNAKDFLKTRMDVSKDIKDDVKNPLLENSSLKSERIGELLYLENIEAGTSGLKDPRVALTLIANLCFANNIHDFHILDAERQLNVNLRHYLKVKATIHDANMVVSAIHYIFFHNITLSDIGNKAMESFATLQKRRDSCRLFLSQRAEGATFGKMVGSTLHYWRKQGGMIYVGSDWGDKSRHEDGAKTWIEPSEKSSEQMANFAIIKVKEEQDFIEYHIMPYAEILNDLGLLDELFYEKLKYGTNDKEIICLLRSGVSLELSKMLIDKYKEFLAFDSLYSTVSYAPGLMTSMEAEKVNPVLIFEASHLL